MINGIISLRCPACTRPFISLPQQAGGMVTCPHCARSAPMDAYAQASAVGASGAPVTSLPILRRVISARPPVQEPLPQQPGTFPDQVSFGRGQPWPQAPEQPPLYHPPQSNPQPGMYPPAPPAPVWSPPMMPSGISPFGVVPAPAASPGMSPPQMQPGSGYADAPTPMPYPMGSGAPPSEPMAYGVPPMPTPFSMPQGSGPMPFSMPQVPQSSGPIPFVMPQAPQGSGPMPFVMPQAPQGSGPMPSMEFAGRTMPDGGAEGAAPGYDAGPSWKPAKDGRNVPLGILLILVLAGGGWLGWEATRPPLAAEFKAPQGTVEEAAGPSPSDAPPAVAGAEAMPSAPPEAEAPEKKPVAEPEPEVRRAQPAFVPETASAQPATEDVDLVAAMEAARRLVPILLGADTPAKRGAVVAQAEEHRLEMDQFFSHGRPKLKSLNAAQVTPRTLPGQEPVPLFQVTTDKNPTSGALLRLVPGAEAGGGFLLDWPLFAETHEKRLGKFLEAKPVEPSWFYVMLRRSHALELPEAVRAGHLCLDLQTSADGTVRCLAVAAVETPLGRYLEREVEWGQVHVARLLLQHRPMPGGARGVAILDCEGAVTGAVFPSGAVKR